MSCNSNVNPSEWTKLFHLGGHSVSNVIVFGTIFLLMLHGIKLLLLLCMYLQPLTQWDSILSWDPGTSLIQSTISVKLGLFFVVGYNQNHERIIVIHETHSEKTSQHSRTHQINSVILDQTVHWSVQ